MQYRILRYIYRWKFAALVSVYHKLTIDTAFWQEAVGTPGIQDGACASFSVTQALIVTAWRRGYTTLLGRWADGDLIGTAQGASPRLENARAGRSEYNASHGRKESDSKSASEDELHDEDLSTVEIARNNINAAHTLVVVAVCAFIAARSSLSLLVCQGAVIPRARVTLWDVVMEASCADAKNRATWFWRRMRNEVHQVAELSYSCFQTGLRRPPRCLPLDARNLSREYSHEIASVFDAEMLVLTGQNGARAPST
ncbi:hypothetical protein BKA62DRAFT_757139, partial [Auriculariales sp. MPI-PUGE-AT-0066]